MRWFIVASPLLSTPSYSSAAVSHNMRMLLRLKCFCATTHVSSGVRAVTQCSSCGVTTVSSDADYCVTVVRSGSVGRPPILSGSQKHCDKVSHLGWYHCHPDHNLRHPVQVGYPLHSDGSSGVVNCSIVARVSLGRQCHHFLY